MYLKVFQSVNRPEPINKIVYRCLKVLAVADQSIYLAGRWCWVVNFKSSFTRVKMQYDWTREMTGIVARERLLTVFMTARYSFVTIMAVIIHYLRAPLFPYPSFRHSSWWTWMKKQRPKERNKKTMRNTRSLDCFILQSWDTLYWFSIRIQGVYRVTVIKALSFSLTVSRISSH